VGVNTTVNEDGSGTIGVRLAADKALQDALQQAGSGLGNLGSVLQGLRDKLPADADMLLLTILGNLPTDWTVDRGTDDDGTKWISVSRSFTGPGELKQLLSSSVLSSFVDANKFSVTQDRGLFSTKTVFSGSAGMSKVAERAQQIDSSLPLKLLAQVLSFENSVTLPGTIEDNNADRVSGNTVVWQLETSGNREMNAESLVYNVGRIVGVAVAALVGLLILLAVLLVLIHDRRQRGRSSEAELQPPPLVPTAAAVAPPAAAEPPPVQIPPTPPTEGTTPAVAEYMLASAVEDEELPEEGV
jgi:hypothetical protein